VVADHPLSGKIESLDRRQQSRDYEEGGWSLTRHR
jgi:hypothetical protein